MCLQFSAGGNCTLKLRKCDLCIAATRRIEIPVFLIRLVSGSCEIKYDGGGVAVGKIRINCQLKCGICTCILDSYSSRLRKQKEITGNRHVDSMWINRRRSCNSRRLPITVKLIPINHQECTRCFDNGERRAGGRATHQGGLIHF